MIEFEYVINARIAKSIIIFEHKINSILHANYCNNLTVYWVLPNNNTNILVNQAEMQYNICKKNNDIMIVTVRRYTYRYTG